MLKVGWGQGHSPQPVWRSKATKLLSVSTKKPILNILPWTTSQPYNQSILHRLTRKSIKSIQTNELLLQIREKEQNLFVTIIIISIKIAHRTGRCYLGMGFLVSPTRVVRTLHCQHPRTLWGLHSGQNPWPEQAEIFHQAARLERKNINFPKELLRTRKGEKIHYDFMKNTFPFHVWPCFHQVKMMTLCRRRQHWFLLW